MVWLKFYGVDEPTHREAYDKKISNEEARMVFKKLCRHYKLRWVNVYFNGRRHGGIAGGGRIEVKHNPSFGLICHEIGHIIDERKRGKSRHDKKLMRILGRVVAYCKKKNYWEDEIKRRTEIKPIPEPPTKEELRSRKIEKRKTAIIRYEKRIGYFTKLYNNKIKKARRSIMALERYQAK